ncbi:flagellin [Maritimibacter alkaliphilus]|uniref:flagellin n=1 Tax=Maritimibacter alkaliphilus TaxID=404236 RepID=UPI001C954C49|nr:flagellin [Maritimibacter alkaliphilus]MBY6093040.1 flagellar hook protein [Maritimibacter alkaliphilus]
MISISNSVSTYGSNLLRRQTVTDLTNQLMKAEYEVTTGLLQDVYGELGARSAQSLTLRSQMATAESFVDSNTLLANRMEVTADALGALRETAQEFLDAAIVNRDSKGSTVETLQMLAKTTQGQLVATANTTYQGAALFSGTATDTTSLQAWDQVNAASGLSPADVMSGIVGTGPTTTAEAEAMIAQLDAVFSSDASAGTSGYETTFYNGTDLLDETGAPNDRLTARIDTGTEISYGVQANDRAFTQLMQGLAMIATTDPAAIDDEDAYEAWMTKAVDMISAGVSGVLELETELGGQQNRVATMIETQESRIDLYNSQILDLEGVDEYEAATRLTTLQTQLQASYQVTSLMNSLSFLNYM